MRKKSVGGANDNQKLGRQTVYQRGSQREGSPHYVFLYSDGEDSGDEQGIPLRPHSQVHSVPRKVGVMKIQLKPDDTLQALALRYHCTISELKRINNIHKENEIYAHRSIKVPITPFSVLTESLDQPESASQDAVVGELVEIQNGPGTSREEQIINLIATPTLPLVSKLDINGTIMSSSCEPLMTEVVEDGESDQLLGASERGEADTPQPHITDTFKCSGDDWGLSWTQLVGCSLLLGLAGPIVYILFLSENFHKQDSTHNDTDIRLDITRKS